MYHTVAYSITGGAALTNGDVSALTDPVISQRNAHYIFTDPFRLLGAVVLGATATDFRLNAPTVNAVARHHFWPIVQGTTIPSNPWWQDMRDTPFNLPQDEEIAIEATNAAIEQATAILFLGTQDWNRNLPVGQQRLTIRATGATALTAFTWSTTGALTFAENLRGGWYALLGAQLFCANCLAARFIFPRSQLYGGRALRPGILAQNAIANQPARWQDGGYGVLGVFHSFEPPQFELLGNAAGAAAQEFRLDLAFLGNTGGYNSAPMIAA